MDDQMDDNQILPHQVRPGTAAKDIRKLLEWAMRKVSPKNPDQTERLIQELQDQIWAFAEYEITEYKRTQDEKRLDVLKRSDWHDSTDAMVWAIKFGSMVRVEEGDGFEPDDVGTLVSWFASAIEVGRRRGYHQGETDALMKYERQLKEQSQKIVAQRNEIEELKRKNDQQARTIGEYQKDANYYQSSTHRKQHFYNPLQSLANEEEVKPEQRRVMTPPRDAGYGKPFDPEKLDMGVKGDPAEITIKPNSSEVFIHKMVTNAEGVVVELDITRGNGERFTYPPRPIRDNPQA